MDAMTYVQFTVTLLTMFGAATALFAWLGRSFGQRFDARFDAIDARFDALDQKIESEVSRLDSKIESEVGRLDSKVDTLGQNIDLKLDAQTRVPETSLGLVDHRLTQLEADMHLVKQHPIGRTDAV